LKRIRDYGIIIGNGKTGELNKITDVPGVKVGNYTLKNEKHNYLKYKTKLEDSYNAYYRIRNVLGHFGELLNSDVYDSNTMLISKPKDAIDTMDEILEALQFD